MAEWHVASASSRKKAFDGIRAGGDKPAFGKGGYPAVNGWNYRAMWWITHNANGTFMARGVHGKAMMSIPPRDGHRRLLFASRRPQCRQRSCIAAGLRCSCRSPNGVGTGCDAARVYPYGLPGRAREPNPPPKYDQSVSLRHLGAAARRKPQGGMSGLCNNCHIRLASCGKECQPRTRWRTFALHGLSAEDKRALKGSAIGHRPLFRQDKHGVSDVFDLHRTAHTRK